MSARRGIDNERRGEQDVIATLAVDRAAHRIDHQAARHRFPLDPCMQFQFRIERLLAAAIGDKLDALEQSAPAHVADKRMIAEALVQASRQMRALFAHIGEKIVAPDHSLHS